MQTRTIPERELVTICMGELCKKAGFPDTERLVQRDLQFLSDSIETQTGVLISLSTIRRLLNGEFSRLPQIATLDAIAKFSGYPNWQGFKNKAPDTSAAPPARQPQGDDSPRDVHPPGPGTLPRGRRPVFTTARLLLSGALLLLAALGLLAIRKAGKPRPGNLSAAQFSAVKVTSNDLPNTVIFRYDVENVTADSFFIQQSWDRNRRVRIDKHSHTLTDIYYEPGYHVAKLIANDQIIKTIDVSIPTDRWFFYAKEKHSSRPTYISSKGIRNGSLQLTKEDLLNSQVDIQKAHLYFQVWYPSKIEGLSDNFVLKFRIRVNELNNDLCPWFVGEVFGQRNFMYFTSSLKGCTSELRSQYGEKLFDGKTYDFSALGADVRTWQNVELTIRNKVVNININGVKAFSAAYDQSCGLITGLGFISNELAEVDSVNLTTLDGKTIYRNDFDQ
jgi:hypothetical protein